MSTMIIPSGPLNRTALAEAVAAETGVSTTQASATVSALLDIIARTTAAGHSVTISNFGTWTVTERAPRAARNLQTGEPIHLPAARGLRFRVAPRLADIVRAGDTTATVRKRPKSS
ncbi:HU family DNA-binding protein [Streptomyces sp. x-80]|uniref:HU family DNA-binding protein n=1 Tax=Streptomyces sp. x-80 TaxID=2789282 RepID=UPI003980AC8B